MAEAISFSYTNQPIEHTQKLAEFLTNKWPELLRFYYTHAELGMAGAHGLDRKSYKIRVLTEVGL